MKYFIILTLLSLISCFDDNSKKDIFLPESVGSTGELVIVIDDDLWNFSIGKTLRKILAKNKKGLPQNEPIFRILKTSENNDIFSKHKNILFVGNTSNEKVVYEKHIDLYAKPQIVQKLNGNDIESLMELIEKNAENIVYNYMDHDIKYLQKNIDESKLYLVPELNRKNIDIKIPNSYFRADSTDNFFWYRKETRKSTFSIMLYIIPITDKVNFQYVNPVYLRDSVTKKNVKSDIVGAYMQIDKAYIPYVDTVDINHKTAVEMRGVWEMKQDFMGGPFVNYLIKDIKNNRVICLDGFIYSPSTPKKNMMLELEAILKTVEIK
ncbi:DUF4837 family protein [Ichthyobacterium seriolicida]|nr:DUF4837 family protein [Ichthyobacterium seriolicida]